jgi:hypothetical protein
MNDLAELKDLFDDPPLGASLMDVHDRATAYVKALEAEVERLHAALRSLYDGACDAWNRMAGYGAVDPELVLPLLAGPLDKAKHALEVKDA